VFWRRGGEEVDVVWREREGSMGIVCHGGVRANAIWTVQCIA